MVKLARFIYRMGRRQAYAEMLAHLETLAVKLPRNREGQLLREPVETAIRDIKADLLEGKNGDQTNA